MARLSEERNDEAQKGEERRGETQRGVKRQGDDNGGGFHLAFYEGREEKKKNKEKKEKEKKKRKDIQKAIVKVARVAGGGSISPSRISSLFSSPVCSPFFPLPLKPPTPLLSTEKNLFMRKLDPIFIILPD